MKKFLSFIVCIALAVSLSACGKESKSDNTVDIEYYAKQGQITDVDFKLGSDPDAVKNELSVLVNEEGESMFTEMPLSEYTLLGADGVFYCYKNDDKSAGITHIASDKDAFGFKKGDVSTLVRDTMSEKGYTATERDPKGNELFFLARDTYTVLEYDFGENTVLFVFKEHSLCATAIHK